MLHTILEEYETAGGNLIDTADVYSQGDFEELIGRWLAAHPTPGEQVVIATTVAPRDGPTSGRSRSPGWRCSAAVKPVTLGVPSTEQLADNPGVTSFELTADELEDELECLDQVSVPVVSSSPHGNAGADQRERAIDVSV